MTRENNVEVKKNKQSCGLELILFYEVVFYACFSTCVSIFYANSHKHVVVIFATEVLHRKTMNAVQ